MTKFLNEKIKYARKKAINTIAIFAILFIFSLIIK